jgi:uroporphyrin-III C-methyltransferase/precorrin-2 dehydrogenase/sirohydrochlorin ferrochelatase
MVENYSICTLKSSSIWKIILVNLEIQLMLFFPVFLDLNARQVALIGAGTAVQNKLRLLLAAGAQVHWFAGDAAFAASFGTDANRISILDDLRGATDWSSYVAVVAAGDVPLVWHIAEQARALNIPVNVIDRPELSTFIVPAIVDRGEVVVAIGTGGASPVLARRLRERIEALLPARIGALAALLGRYRERFAARKHKALVPRAFWERIVDGPIAAAFLAGRAEYAERELVRAIDDAAQVKTASAGTVHLVGAGPGDPDLLTLRALQVLQSADIVFHDDLIEQAILDRARRDAEFVFVGKRRGHPGIGQDAIHMQLAEAARAGKRVVRLKGGDPFIFGRGGEEAEYLRARGIPVVVVPGVTAALGCAAEAAIPLTFRNEATKLTLLTAHRADQAAATNWAGLGDPQTTVAVYMGLSAAAAVRDGLIAAGRDAKTPAAVLARGTHADARRIYGRLGDLPALAAQAGPGPALLIIGDVVAHAAEWPQTSEAAEWPQALLVPFEAAA